MIIPAPVRGCIDGLIATISGMSKRDAGIS